MKYQNFAIIFVLLILPISYILLKFWGILPEYVFFVHIFIEICTQIVRLKIVLPMIKIKMNDYIQSVITPIVLVVITAPILPYIFYKNIEIVNPTNLKEKIKEDFENIINGFGEDPTIFFYSEPIFYY